MIIRDDRREVALRVFMRRGGEMGKRGKGGINVSGMFVRIIYSAVVGSIKESNNQTNPHGGT